MVACNTALISSLHNIFDNYFFSKIIEKLIKITKKLCEELSNDKKDDNHQPLKYLMMIWSYFYVFESISVEFIYGVLKYLLEFMNDTILEILIIFVQNIGAKIRADNPTILKDLIELISQKFEEKKNDEEFTKKSKFLILTLNDIKLNKMKTNPLERLNFLCLFIKKNVINK